MKDLISTLDLLVTQFERMSIEYVIMGGLAVRAYAIPRATEDIDFTLALDRHRLPELFRALESDAYTVPDAYKTGWVDDVKGLKLVKIKRYVLERSIDVDLFLAESRYQDEGCDENAWPMSTAGAIGSPARKTLCSLSLCPVGRAIGSMSPMSSLHKGVWTRSICVIGPWNWELKMN